MLKSKVDQERELQARWRGSSGRTTLPRSILEIDDLDVAVATSEEVHATRSNVELQVGDRCQVLDVTQEDDSGLWFDCTLGRIENNLHYGNFGKKKSWSFRGYERKHLRPSIIRIDYQLPRRHPNAAVFQALVSAVRFDKVQLCTGEKAFILVNDVSCYKIEVIVNKKVRRLSYLKVLTLTKQKHTNRKALAEEVTYTTQRSPSIGPVQQKLSEFIPHAFRLKTSKETEDSAIIEPPRLSKSQKQGNQKSSVKRRRAPTPPAASGKRRVSETKDEAKCEEMNSQRQLFSNTDMAPLEYTKMMPFCDPSGADFSAGENLVMKKLESFCGNDWTGQNATIANSNIHRSDISASRQYNSPESPRASPAHQHLFTTNEQKYKDDCDIQLKNDADWCADTSHMIDFKESVLNHSSSNLFGSTTTSGVDSMVSSVQLDSNSLVLADKQLFADSDVGSHSLLPFALMSTPYKKSQSSMDDLGKESPQMLSFAGSINTPLTSQPLEDSVDITNYCTDIEPLTPNAVSKIHSLAELELSSSSTGQLSTASPTDFQMKMEASYDFKEDDTMESPTIAAYTECFQYDSSDVPPHRIHKGEKPPGSRVILLEGLPGCVVWFDRDIQLITEPMLRLAVRKATAKESSIDRLYVFVNSLLHQLCRKLPRPYFYGEPPIGKFSDKVTPKAVADEQPAPFSEIINAAITQYNIRDSQGVMFRRAVYTIISRIKKNKRNQKHHHRNKIVKKE